MTTSTQIMNDMDRTRDEIRATLSAITERASVERLVQRYVVPSREGAVEFGRVFADAVRANPLPLGLTALGLGWLMLGQRHRPVERIVYDGPSGGAIGDEESDAEAGEGVGSRVEEGLRRAGERAEEAKRRVGETVEEAKRHAGETVDEAKRRVGETMEKAKSSARHLAEETVGRVRDAAGKGRQWTADTAGRASDTIRHSVETASEMGGRVRHAARRPVGYAREHPLALGAVLVIGGAAVALLLARRPTVVLEEDEDLAPAGMPETPYASGTQAEMGGLHRNPTEPLTPEEEEPVFAAGDVSEAAQPATGTTEAEREVVATAPSAAQEAKGR